jgi:predicted nucleotidyltransferase component of viral defense system
MGKNSILTRTQKLILAQIAATDFIRSEFYFTGGTALSEVYLKHRESVDLDFFSERKFEPQTIFNLISGWAREFKFSFEPQFVEPTHIYILNFKNSERLKLDFAYYPYKRLRRGTSYEGIEVDSKLDIAVNKTLLISSQRTEVKDFVDLYFLLDEFTVWDLIEGVGLKFGNKIEPFILASDFMAVEDFEFLPRMCKKLSLQDLRKRFLQEARSLGMKSTK